MLRFITTADTEILATATAVERLPASSRRFAAPTQPERQRRLSIDDLLDGARVVLCQDPRRATRLAGRVRPAARALQRAGIALLALGGEAAPDAEMTGLSLAPAGAVAQAGEYLRHGDVDNVEQLLRFLADTFLLEGHGFEPPHDVADLGVYLPGVGDVELERALAGHDRSVPLSASASIRSHRLTGNTAFVDAICAAIEDAGANALAVWSYTLRREQPLRTGRGTCPRWRCSPATWTRWS